MSPIACSKQSSILECQPSLSIEAESRNRSSGYIDRHEIHTIVSSSTLDLSGIIDCLVPGCNGGVEVEVPVIERNICGSV